MIPVQRRRKATRNGERGFAMLVVFLMAAAIAISLYVEIPRVAFESQRNREEMLMERGEQYKRGVELYYRKLKTYPQKIEDLENTNNFRFLRKRYKDPLTGKDEWRIVHMGPQGLTDSLVEKMPGLDGDKDKGKKDGSQMASNSGGSGTGGSNDPNKPPDEPGADAIRTARDQRALAAQRGAGAMGGGGPMDPNVADQANFEQMQRLQQQYALQQQQQQQQGIPPTLDPNSQNPGGPPTNVTVNNNNGAQPNNPFYQPSQQQQPQPYYPGQNPPPGLPPIGSPGGPVRTLYPPSGAPPFNQGNAMIRGALPNPGSTVANSSNNSGMTSAFSSLGSNNAAVNAINSAIRSPQQRASAFGNTQNQQFGGVGIAGIASNATGVGIKRYNERSKYKEWEFVYDYRKPAKGAKKGVTGVGGLNTTNNPGNTGSSNSSFGGNNGGSSGFSGGMNGGSGSSGFGNSRRP